VGPAGCGKTQFCSMMCVATAMLHSHNCDGISGATIYIDTESAFSPCRLETFTVVLLMLSFFTYTICAVVCYWLKCNSQLPQMNPRDSLHHTYCGVHKGGRLV